MKKRFLSMILAVVLCGLLLAGSTRTRSTCRICRSGIY